MIKIDIERNNYWFMFLPSNMEIYNHYNQTSGFYNTLLITTWNTLSRGFENKSEVNRITLEYK